MLKFIAHPQIHDTRYEKLGGGMCAVHIDRAEKLPATYDEVLEVSQVNPRVSVFIRKFHYDQICRYILLDGQTILHVACSEHPERDMLILAKHADFWLPPSWRQYFAEYWKEQEDKAIAAWEKQKKEHK